MSLPQMLPFAKRLMKDSLSIGDTAIDATAGNGHDTLFLASLVGEKGKVYSFDIQETAIINTRERLEKEQITDRVTLIHDSHDKIEQYCKDDRPKAAIFNLGYLPGSNKEVTTTGETTVKAIQQLLTIMPVKGTIVLVVYHGHEEGKQEKDQLLAYIRNLSHEHVLVAKYEFMNHKNDAPFIVALEKRREGDFL
ncbi:class I SAM-dependent methyltransferase [Geomicrobium sp. JCM 19055]|uniref:class I SAM-dependent methyltransferase n=1 Tax=Geomicrobium sp. JCM 19055 TaxID=1460649 RepID=UPI00045ED148|nr:class I SAM-dependent methyltransferase [Geomicrobium sp. JCM 19055]GAJ99459.1 SAM-dependent methyltransferase, MraW methylase family [Geomicrobium sp. JCM 19055]